MTNKTANDECSKWKDDWGNEEDNSFESLENGIDSMSISVCDPVNGLNDVRKLLESNNSENSKSLKLKIPKDKKVKNEKSSSVTADEKKVDVKNNVQEKNLEDRLLDQLFAEMEPKISGFPDKLKSNSSSHDQENKPKTMFDVLDTQVSFSK